jgi:hypothetical protein
MVRPKARPPGGAPADESIHDGNDVVFLVIAILRFEHLADVLEVI